MKTKLTLLLFVAFSTIFAINAQTVKQMNSKEVDVLLKKDKSLVVLDVRTKDEFDGGHIKGATNIDIRESDALTKIDKLDKSKTYIVHCRTNHRSKIAADHMQLSGFKNIIQMSDGFMGWSGNGLPVEK